MSKYRMNVSRSTRFHEAAGIRVICVGWSGTRLPLLLADFWSTGFRVKFGRILPRSVKLHEHQNYFHVAAMSALVRKAGFELLECRAADFQALSSHYAAAPRRKRRINPCIRLHLKTGTS